MTARPDREAILGVAREACRLGGEKLTALFGSALEKNILPHDIKSQADLESEKVMRAFLAEKRPEDAVMGEEEGGALELYGGCWVVDPLDGTINFSHGIRYFAVTAAWYWMGEPEVGVIFDPNANHFYYAVKGRGAFCDGKPLRVSKTDRLKEAMVFVGCGKGSDIACHWRNLEKVVARIHSVRFKCCATLDLAALAGGLCDGYTDQGLYLWDFAAGALILKEAGGEYETKAGSEPGTYDFLGGNPAVFKELKKL
ncbi:inositol monophosphatase [bacterium]|nr:inositol monophosphatase [bacterium]